MKLTSNSFQQFIEHCWWLIDESNCRLIAVWFELIQFNFDPPPPTVTHIATVSFDCHFEWMNHSYITYSQTDSMLNGHRQWWSCRCKVMSCQSKKFMALLLVEVEWLINFQSNQHHFQSVSLYTKEEEEDDDYEVFFDMRYNRLNEFNIWLIKKNNNKEWTKSLMKPAIIIIILNCHCYIIKLMFECSAILLKPDSTYIHNSATYTQIDVIYKNQGWR